MIKWFYKSANNIFPTIIKGEKRLAEWQIISWLWLKIILVAVLISLIPYVVPPPTPVWGTKPVLGYFIFTASLSEVFKLEAGLNETQYRSIHEIAEHELESLSVLELESMRIIRNQNLSLEQKRTAIQEMKYNLEVQEIIGASQSQLKEELGAQAYSRMESWIKHRWLIERELHGSVIQKNAGPRTFEVFATRYDAGSAYYAALPDQCLKLTNGGSHICEDDGYKVGQEYSVYLSYKKSVAVRVGETGPWNIDDNYWATFNDPTPRRLFADLPLGMPEAQAAYFDGYNGGLDQYGRVVTAPFGIDLSFDVAKDIGLPSKKNDWIQVSYLWTDGWNGSSTYSGGNSTPAATQVEVHPVVLVTPQEDGSIIHKVQAGQTLWDIAVNYQVTLSEIYLLNGISEGDVIRPGEEILVKTAQVDYSPGGTDIKEKSVTKSVTAILEENKITPERTQVPDTPLSQAHIVPAEKSNPSETQVLSTGDLPSVSIRLKPMLLLIGLLVILGMVLLLVGTWMDRKE